MNRLWTGVVVLALLAGCETTPTRDQAGAPVEDRGKPLGPEAAKPPAPKADTGTKPIVDKPMAVNPLRDPGNILSKRSVYFDFDSNLVKDEFKPDEARLYQSRNGKYYCLAAFKSAEKADAFLKDEHKLYTVRPYKLRAGFQ